MTILVGFTPFIAGSGSWQNAIEIKQANPIIFYLICGLSLIAAFISCSIECKKVASISTRQALSRAFWVTLYGFIFSIAVAILFSMTVGSLYVEDVTANFGFLEFSSVKISIYPAPVILFSSIALFLGIFVNTYSRSEPVTTPF